MNPAFVMKLLLLMATLQLRCLSAGNIHCSSLLSPLQHATTVVHATTMEVAKDYKFQYRLYPEKKTCVPELPKLI